ncbi:hypothetical protein BDY21DRAFT_289059 [Lineolata rhizophorae]|uniref:FAD/NAD(P)-binding domain-containing protein n=1 Tax=Lineolata rhizophorae TaxID=578093 RepID=A0A6A6NUK4_9PEZI|nr:hypothetical protein BDY21DRAFT_289059 [Lineolata rhizophorae]
MSRDTFNILILGGSFAGLSVAHQFLANVRPLLSQAPGAPDYRVVLVSPSTHIYWNIGAPRALVSADLVPIPRSFVNVEAGFKQYSFQDLLFVQGEATGLDAAERTVTVSCYNVQASIHSIPYHALVIATGSSSNSPLFSLHGPHERTMHALADFHTRLHTARSVLIVGGGPSGCETAGQMMQHFNRLAKEEQARMQPPSLSPYRTITLLSGGERLLPRLPESVARKAERQLKGLGVHVVHSLRLVAAKDDPDDGRINCYLSNEDMVTVDAYVLATGVLPNTNWLPHVLLDGFRYVATDPQTLRVRGDDAGERVYAVGDCASYSKNYVLDVYEAVPVLVHNLRNDLLAHEMRMLRGREGGASEEEINLMEDAGYMQNPTETQLLPITKRGGVGVVFDFKLPSFMVWVMKGRNYRVGKAKSVVHRGKDPYADPV